MTVDENLGPLENDGGPRTNAKATNATATGGDTERATARADVVAYIEKCYPGLAGKLFTPIGHRPRWLDGGKYGHTDFKGNVSFDYPSDDLDANVDRLLEQAQSADVYVCPNLMHKDRTPGSCVGAKVIHVDWDGDPNDTEAVLEKVRALDGFAVASGTPGHIHAYVPLAEPVHAARAKLLCKAFQAALPPGSDKGKHSVNDLLRPPGTINHKTGARVEFLIRPGADRWDPMALEQYLGMCADASGNGSGVTNPAQVAVPVDLANYPHVRAALQTSVLKQDGTVDRSKTIYAVLGACLDDGLTLAEARAAVRSRADLADKLDGVGGDDATRIWLKLVDKQQGPQRITGDHRCDEAPISKGDKEKTHIEGMPRLWRATDLKAAAQPRWLAKGRIPCAAVSLLVGDEGIGKSLLWAWIIAAVTTGKALPEFGIPAREPSRVIIVVTEDGWQDTVLPRLEVAGADLNMIQVICTEEDGSGSPLFPRDLDLIRDADPPPSAVVVDAWLDTVHASLSVRDPQQARQALHPWKEVATTTGAAILLLCHTNRVATPNARDRYGATGELRKKARMTLYAQADEDGCLLVGPEKANGAKTLPASRFKAASVQYWPPTEEHDGTVPLLTYLGESEQTAREHLAEGYAVDHEPGTDDGVGWLAAFLGGGPRWSVDVHTAREEANISEKKLRAAKKRLNVDSRRAANDGPWFMALPQHAGRQPDAQMAPVSDAWTCGTSGGHLENPPALSTSQDSQRVDGETRGHLDDAEARRPRLGERCTVCLEHPLWAPESIRRGICEPCWQNSKSSNV